jgi:hypothetical protein
MDGGLIPADRGARGLGGLRVPPITSWASAPVVHGVQVQFLNNDAAMVFKTTTENNIYVRFSFHSISDAVPELRLHSSPDRPFHSSHWPFFLSLSLSLLFIHVDTLSSN